MEQVVSMLSTIFWAVPDFIRVEPEMTSGPTSGAMHTSQSPSSLEWALVHRPMTAAPRSRALRRAAST